MRIALAVLGALLVSGSELTQKHSSILGSFEKSLDSVSAGVNETSVPRVHTDKVQALLKVGKKRSSTLDHFNDKIDEVCIELAKEVQNATKCLAPAAYDLRVKSMSFQRVLEYYQYEIETFRTNWRSVLKKFTDNAQTFIENPLASSLIQEKMMFGSKAEQGEPDESAGPDPEAVIKEFRTVYDINAKVVPDHRDYDVGPNLNQEKGYEIDGDEQPLDRLRIDGMRPFPTAAGWNETGSTASIYRQKYGEEYNPIPPGQQAPEYILDRKGGDIFNIEDYAQRFIFWRNEHVAAFNNFIFATGPYQAAALAYSTVLKELAQQVEQIKATTLLTFRGYYEGEQNKKIENAIRLYQQRSFDKAGDIIPDEIKAFQTSPIQACGNCEVRYGNAFKNRLAGEGVCLPNQLFPCGPQRRTDGTLALNPYYLWNDQTELWKARFQQMDSISTYMWNQRKVSLLQANSTAVAGVSEDGSGAFDKVYGAIAEAVGKVQSLMKARNMPVTLADDATEGAVANDGKSGSSAPNENGVFSQDIDQPGIAVVHEKVNAAGKAQDRAREEDEYEKLVKLGSGKNNPKGVPDNLKPEELTSGNHHLNNFVNKGREDVHAQNMAQYLSDNDMTNRWDAVNEADSHIIHNKYGYPHPIIKSEPQTMSQFKAVASQELHKELQYQEILQQGRWEKLYNDAMDKLIKDYGYSLDFLREESFKIAYETSRRKFDHCSSTLKKRIPSFMGVDAAAIAANAKADEEEKNTSPDYRTHVKDLLDRYANAQEGTAVVCHEAMMCVEAGRYELELAANAYRLVLEQMSSDVADTALRWSDAVKDLGTAWAGNAFSTLLSTKALPTAMMQRANGITPSKMMMVNKHHIQKEVKKSMALKQKMLTPNELYEDINIKFNPRDFVMEYRVVFWKTRQAFINVYRHFVYTMGPYQAAADAYLASMKEFSSEIDHKIGTFLGKANSAIVDGTWTHENTYNMYWSSFRNGVGLLRTAKHIVAQANKQNLYIQQWLLRAWHMRLDTGKMEIGGCDPAHYAKTQEIDGHKYEDARPSGQGHAQQEGNRLGRGTHPCFLGQYTNNNGYVESLPAITWMANEYDQAFGNEEIHGDASKCKKTKKILAKYRCNGGDDKDTIEAPEQYPGTDGIPGASRFDNLKCTTGHLLVDQALYKFAYQIWLSHVDHTEATSFEDWLGYDTDTHKPNMKDYAACTAFLHQYSYTKFEKQCVSDKSPILKTLIGQTVEACQAECDANEDCLSFEYGVDYSGERHQAGDCQLRSSIDYFQCDGEAINLDVYMKKVTACQAFGQGQIVETAKKPYKIDGAVTLKAGAKAAVATKKAAVTKKAHMKRRRKRTKHSKHDSKKLAKGFASYIELREEHMAKQETLKAMQKSKIKSPAGFKAYMYCESDDDCDHAPGSEHLPRLKCESPDFSIEHTVYNSKTGKNEPVKHTGEAPRKFCVGPGREGDHCNQFLCSFGMSCTKTMGGKCARDSYKYHDWWTYDDGRTTHASTNTYGLEYRKARDYFLSCNAGIQKALIGFVDAWAAANQLSHRMEERICGGQVKEQEGTGTELGMLQRP